MKKQTLFFLALVAVLVFAPSAFAAEGGAKNPNSIYIVLGAVLGLSFTAFGGALAMGNAITGSLSAMARNPGLYQRLFPSMLIGLALIESLVIYTLVIVLILLYANPL